MKESADRVMGEVWEGGRASFKNIFLVFSVTQLSNKDDVFCSGVLEKQTWYFMWEKKIVFHEKFLKNALL